MSSTTNTTIEEKDEAFFSDKGIVKFDDYFYQRPKDGIISGIDSNVFISSNTFGFETLQCKEFKPNQFAILGLLDTLKEFWNLGVSLGEIAAKEAEQQTNTAETHEQLASKTEKLKQNAIKAKNKITKLAAAGYLALLYTLNGHKRMQDGTDAIASTEQSKFITGEKRQHVVDELKRLDLFYDFPHFFYENLVNGIYGRTFQLPLIDYNSYVESSSDGQFTVGNFSMNGVKAALDKLIGETAQMGLPTGITWTKKDSYKTVGYTIKLYNSTITKLITNIDFINNIVAGNMWAQNNVFLSPASLYDVKIPSRHTRLYYCTGSFVCNYEGKVRLLGQPNVMWKPIANIYPKGVDRDKLTNNLEGLKNTLKSVQLAHSITMNLVNKTKTLKLEKSTGLLDPDQLKDIKDKITNGFSSLDEQYEIIKSVEKIETDVWKHFSIKIREFYEITLKPNLTRIKTCLSVLISKFGNYRKMVKVASSIDGKEADTQTVAEYDQSTGKVIKTTKPNGTGTAAVPAKYKADSEEPSVIGKAETLKNEVVVLLDRIEAFIADAGSREAKANVEAAQETVEAAQETAWYSFSTKADNNAVAFYEIKDVLDRFKTICKDAIDIRDSSDYIETTGMNSEPFTRDDRDKKAESLKAEEANILSAETKIINAANEQVKNAEAAVKQAEDAIAKSVVTLTPAITHIPDIFNLNVKFTSLLPNNFNTYLYSIENCNVDLYSMSNNKNPKLAKFVKTFGTNYVDVLSNDTALTNASEKLLIEQTPEIKRNAERDAALAAEHIIPTIPKAYDGYDVKNDERYTRYYAKQLDLYTYLYTTEYIEKNPTKHENYSLLIKQELELFSNTKNVNDFMTKFGFDSDSPGDMMKLAESKMASAALSANDEFVNTANGYAMNFNSKFPTTNDANT